MNWRVAYSFLLFTFQQLLYFNDDGDDDDGAVPLLNTGLVENLTKRGMAYDQGQYPPQRGYSGDYYEGQGQQYAQPHGGRGQPPPQRGLNRFASQPGMSLAYRRGGDERGELLAFGSVLDGLFLDMRYSYSYLCFRTSASIARYGFQLG